MSKLKIPEHKNGHADPAPRTPKEAKEQIEKGNINVATGFGIIIGATVGTVVAGPVGGYIGGALGGTVGFCKAGDENRKPKKRKNNI